jgi:DNA-binding PadR family transcriptional regulator
MGIQGILAGLLVGGPAHGYQLKATLEEELGPLWVTSASQVYLTLGRMQRDGVVSSRRVRQERRPDRQLLALTASGRALAAEWLFESDDPDESVVRLAVARLVVPDRFAELTEIIAEQRSTALTELRSLRRDATQGFQREAIDAEIQRVQADLRWTAAVRDHAEAILKRPPGAHGSAASARYG